MFFLDWLIRRKMGEPTSEKDGGSWECPKCGHERFHVRPHKPEFKDRAACWNCDSFWDENDIIREHHPGLSYPKRVVLLEKLRNEYARESRSSYSQCRGSAGVPGRDFPSAAFSPRFSGNEAEFLSDGGPTPGMKALMNQFVSGQATDDDLIALVAEFRYRRELAAANAESNLWQKERKRRLQVCVNPDCLHANQCQANYDDRCLAANKESETESAIEWPTHDELVKAGLKAWKEMDRQAERPKADDWFEQRNIQRTA